MIGKLTGLNFRIVEAFSSGEIRNGIPEETGIVKIEME